MKAKIQMLKLGVAALLLAMPVHSLCAAPARTGIRVQAFFYQPGFAVEVEPGVWIGDGGFSWPAPSSFTVRAAHSGRSLGHFAAEAGSSLEVSLPPGNYIVVPDTLFGLAAPPAPIQVTVRAKHYTEVFIYYGPTPISVAPQSP